MARRGASSDCWSPNRCEALLPGIFDLFVRLFRLLVTEPL
jgi:hypothetical protein